MSIVYSFSAESIQSYIFRSNQLKDMVAASEQIEQLCEPLLERVLKALGIDKKTLKSPRCAGGTFIIELPNEETAKNFRDLWSLVIRNHFPGLSFKQSINEYPNLIGAVNNNSTATTYSDFCPIFPIAGPLVARTPRLGEVAVDRIKLLDNEGTEWIDIETKGKRGFLKKINQQKSSLLEKKFELNAGPNYEVCWPIHMEKQLDEETKEHQLFPLLKENRYIGVVHADGNGFGDMMDQIVKKINDNKLHYQSYRELSDSISYISIRAANKAVQKLIDEKCYKEIDNIIIMPVRPLILGGEDLTVIVRADCALLFTKTYLEEFEKASKIRLNELKEKYSFDLPNILTACAGIAFIKSSQPFHQAYQLADSLCEAAKTESKIRRNKFNTTPSSIAFHRITTSMITNYKDIHKRELTVGKNESIREISMQPYAVGEIQPSKHLPELKDLEKLCEHLKDEELSQGAIRELLNLIYLSPSRSKLAFERWKGNMKKAKLEEKMESIMSTINHLIPVAEDDFPIFDKQRKATPLADALSWIAVTRGSHD